jgi:hypothetical protein
MRMTPTDMGYLIESSSGASISLTLEEAVRLAPLARQIEDHIRSRYPRTYPAYSYQVSEVILGLDAHQTMVLLQMQGPDGLRSRYQLSLDTAKSTRDGLNRKIEEIEGAKPTTQ